MSTRVEPSPPLLTCALMPLDCAGSCWMMSPTVERPEASRTSRFMTVSGAGVVSVLRSIVEPVTVMTSSLASASASFLSSSSLRFGVWSIGAGAGAAAAGAGALSAGAGVASGAGAGAAPSAGG
jgi:hypothetical protein